jgi:hypothetical protein
MGHATHKLEKLEKHVRFWLKILEESQLGDLGIDMKIILKLNLEK